MNYLKNPLLDFRNSFCLGFLWKAKLERVLSFRFQSGKTTVCIMIFTSSGKYGSAVRHGLHMLTFSTAMQINER